MYILQSHICVGVFKNINVIIKCERSEPEKMNLNCGERTCYNLMRAKRIGKIKIELSRAKRKICTFSPNSNNVRSDYLFSYQKKKDFLFPAFSRSEYLFPISASPPPPPSESNGRPLIFWDTLFSGLNCSEYILQSISFIYFYPYTRIGYRM